MSRPILVDCDGVLSNLIGSVLTLAHERAGIFKTEADITHYDYGKALEWPRWGVEVEQAVLHREFVYRMRPYSGAFLFLRNLENAVGKENVFVCTKPWKGLPEWIAQRSAWLIDFAGVPTERQIHISNKNLVPGLLIDDDPSNLAGRSFHDAYCVARPWNVGAPFTRGSFKDVVDSMPVVGAGFPDREPNPWRDGLPNGGD
jgi:5'(3')-deoxyribonucleotidase